jgi:class 3 adenylate cyclase
VQGNSFFVAFPRAKDAVSAAVAAQRALAAPRWPKGAAVRVRIGLHTGEPTVAEPLGMQPREICLRCGTSRP